MLRGERSLQIALSALLCIMLESGHHFRLHGPGILLPCANKKTRAHPLTSLFVGLVFDIDVSVKICGTGSVGTRVEGGCASGRVCVDAFVVKQ